MEDLRSAAKCLFSIMAAQNTDHVLACGRAPVLYSKTSQASLRNNSLLQLSEEASKYQANDRGSYSFIINLSFGGYRFGARGFGYTSDPGAAVASRQENAGQRIASAVRPHCSLGKRKFLRASNPVLKA